MENRTLESLVVGFLAGLIVAMAGMIVIEVTHGAAKCQALEDNIATVELVYAGYNDGCVLAGKR